MLMHAPSKEGFAKRKQTAKLINCISLAEDRQGEFTIPLPLDFCR
jgi:hypothetical protein